jgi:catechol 2,3-dioxygenase-like lactoylglutathione lyase family enzyme
MPLQARYVHTNLIARDWLRLARFYQEVFGCVPVPPQRDFSGEHFDQLTGLTGARLQGMHLRLPGYGDSGPTLEIFSYTPDQEQSVPTVDRRGFGHIAFAVEDVAAARLAVLEAGGGTVGEIVSLQIAGGAKVELCYLTDPEGNIVEVQRWG